MYYETLGISKNASQDDIKKAYRKLAMKHHPDKGGDSETFKKISEAFAVLSDEQKKRNFDTYGKAEPEMQHSNNSPFDIFENLFQRQTRRNNIPTACDYYVSLEDVFKGKTIRMNVTHDTACQPCNGQGTTKPPITCETCRGVGYTQHQIQMGPMCQIIRQPCNMCNGQGKMHDPKYKCTVCNGSSIKKDTETVDLNIKPGMKNGSLVSLVGMGDYTSTQGKTNLTVRLRYKEHPHIHVNTSNCILIKLYISMKLYAAQL
jgi:DnaJ family protein A protein 2